MKTNNRYKCICVERYHKLCLGRSSCIAGKVHTHPNQVSANEEFFCNTINKKVYCIPLNTFTIKLPKRLFKI